MAKKASITDNNPLANMFTKSPAEVEQNKPMEVNTAPQAAKPRKKVTPAKVKPKAKKAKPAPPTPQPVVQTSFQAYQDQLDWIDQSVLEARKGGGRKIRKTDILRSIIDFARELEPNFTGIQSEDELRNRLFDAMRKYKS